MPKSGLPTGTEIRNEASIVFDVNPAIETPEWLNTIDASNPESQVCSLDAVQPITDFTVTWSGTDEGAGIQDYTIYVSEDGGPFSLWLQDTPDSSAVYSGHADTDYSFYSEARDLTGNRESKVATIEATTQVLGNCMTGNVNGVTGVPSDVLMVNGSAGDANRIVTAATGESLQFDFLASPAGPASGRYLLWVWRASTVNSVVLSAQGSVIGCLANPSPLNAETPKPFLCVRGAQIPPIVCTGSPEFMGPPMVPWTLTKGMGFAIPSTFILQGIVQDNGALNPFGYSVSNAVMLEIQ